MFNCALPRRCGSHGPITAVLPHVKKRLQSLVDVGQMCSVTLLSIQAGKTVNQNVLRANYCESKCVDSLLLLAVETQTGELFRSVRRWTEVWTDPS